METAANNSVNQILSQANRAFQSKDMTAALHLTEQALSVSPFNPHALSFKLGLLLSTHQLSQADDTVSLLLSEQCQIHDHQLFINNTQTLLRFSRFRQALMFIKTGLNACFENPALQALAVNTAIEARDLDTANSIADELTRKAENTIQSSLTMANLNLMSGNFEQAKDYFCAVLKAESNNSYALAGLTKTERFDPSDRALVPQYKAAIQSNSLADAKARIGLGLAKLYNDFGEYDLAWETAEAANKAKRQTARFEPKQFTHQVDKLLAYFTPHNIQAQHSENSTEHVFVVGMPRSGTTLIEQVLSVVPGFYAGGETPAIDYCLSFGKYGDHYLQAFEQQKDLDLAAMSSAYEDYFHQFSNYSGNRIINKVPTNFFHIGLIKLLFPKAKIINMERAPLDLAVSIFFENFSPYFAYTNSLDNIFHVYGQYKRLMEHWSGLYGSDILTVNYQSMVENYQQEVDRIGEFIEADMPSIEQIRDASNPVETPSVWQVRQPINTNAVNRWQKYQQYLQPYIKSYQ